MIADKHNNFGACRLLFAVLVILSHSFELVDGNRSRELLTRAFGTMSFGEVAVDGFFLISGYLITKSFLASSGDWRGYLRKRVLRIYPGFVVAVLLCLALAPLVGGHLDQTSVLWQARRLLLLRPPVVPDVFVGLPSPALNGSLWSIEYEFRCYLLVLVLGVAGLLAKRHWILAATVIGLVLTALDLPLWGWVPQGAWAFIGRPATSIRLTTVFGCGALFYLYRDWVRYDWRAALVAAVVLIAAMFSRHLAEAAFMTLGGYLLFWFAFTVRIGLHAIGGKTDLSYGTYLYAFPIQNCLIWFVPGIAPWAVFMVSAAGALLLAYGSWRLVEKPCMALKPARRSHRSHLEATP